MPYQLPAPDEKAAYVRGRFDAIARRYDLFNDLITQGQHRRWKQVLVRRLGLPAGARGVDLCCGTGDIAARLASVLSAPGGVVALDFSGEMLRIARGRLARLPGGAGRLVACGDAMRLPIRDGSLDFVTVGYGLRNVASLPGCLEEIGRVLTPGGVLASLDVGKVRSPVLRPFAEAYLFHVVPRIGRMLQPGQEMYTYLPHSTLDYPGQAELAGLMAAHGFERVEVVEFLFGAAAIHLARKAGGSGGADRPDPSGEGGTT